MPNYGSAQSGSGLRPDGQYPLTVLQPGDSLALFNAETPTAPQASIAFERGYAPGGQGATEILFTIDFAVAPTDSLLIQGANIDTDADYQTLYTSTNTQHDKYGDAGGFNFYRAKLNTGSAGGALTVIAQR